MNAMSTPPGARGPPSAVQRRPFFRIHASKLSFASFVRRRLGSATPWRMLWLFFVVRNTDGDGFGTYLRISSNVSAEPLPYSRHLQNEGVWSWVEGWWDEEKRGRL